MTSSDPGCDIKERPLAEFDDLHLTLTPWILTKLLVNPRELPLVGQG
jgi:hypothetical protein